MMSVIIKGMKMPEYCIDCYFYASNSRNDSCLLLKRTLGDNGDREGDCPLADVPTPHGRLIDGDELMKSRVVCDPEEWDDTFRDGCDAALEVVRNAPTIIEARFERD